VAEARDTERRRLVTATPDVGHVLPTFSSLLASTVYLLSAATDLGCGRIVLASALNERTADGTAPSSPYAAAEFCGSLYGQQP
jgi:hypothetical protein